jgi:hypothetical protein
VEDWFFEIGHVIQVRCDEIIAFKHFPGNFRIASFVWFQQSVVSEGHKVEHRHDGKQDDHILSVRRKHFLPPIFLGMPGFGQRDEDFDYYSGNDVVNSTGSGGLFNGQAWHGPDRLFRYLQCNGKQPYEKRFRSSAGSS